MHELSAQSELLCPVAIGEEAKIANALEAVGKDVKQEPADEFLCVKRHELLAVAIAIILPAKLHLAVIDIEQAIVGNRDAMRVSRDILEDLFRSGEGLFGVHHPILFSGKSDVTQEGVAYAKWFQAGKELQIAGIEGLPEIIQRSRQLLNQMRWWSQRSQRSTWPPSAAVRHSSIALMTRRCAVHSEASWVSR